MRKVVLEIVMEKIVEMNGENSSPLMSFPVKCLNGDRLQRQPFMPISKVEISAIFIRNTYFSLAVYI